MSSRSSPAWASAADTGGGGGRATLGGATTYWKCIRASADVPDGVSSSLYGRPARGPAVTRRWLLAPKCCLIQRRSAPHERLMSPSPDRREFLIATGNLALGAAVSAAPPTPTKGG